MAPEIDRLTPGTQIGDYLLTALLYDGPTTRTWEAQQISIDREVIVDSLNWDQQQDENFVATFLSDVRTKAAIDHPLIGSVFQAVQNERHCFFAREKLSGTSLQQLHDVQTSLTPFCVAHILRQSAEANLYLEKHQLNSLPLQADQIFISDQSHCRFVNVAVGGERDPNNATADKHTLATTLLPMLQGNLPGSTRTQSLLDFMADLEREHPLSWEQIRELAEGIEHHISHATETQQQNSVSQRIQRRKKTNKGVTFAVISGALALAVFAVSKQLNQPAKPKVRQLSQMVHIPAESSAVSDFWIDAHEVTIAEYAEFLKDMDVLTAEQRAAFQHPEQPPSKADHQPLHWQNLYPVASAGSQWNGQSISPNHPVTGVDWWDAFAYSAYKNRQLPTTAQWQAALSHSLTEKDQLTASGWGPVDQQSDDITANAIYGLAGNVTEWSASVSRDPSFPTKPKTPVLLGGSYRKANSSATTQGWASDDSYNTRREDLGFRTISTTAPTE